MSARTASAGHGNIPQRLLSTDESCLVEDPAEVLLEQDGHGHEPAWRAVAAAPLAWDRERGMLLAYVPQPDGSFSRQDIRFLVTVAGHLSAGLEKARLHRARALVANGTDDENAAIILAARQLGFAGDVVALVEEPYHRKPMMLAGATAVYTPRHILGAALAARARFDGRIRGRQRRRLGCSRLLNWAGR